MTCLTKQQWLPISIQECWQFFSNPLNLNKITPSYLSFNIKSQLPPQIYEGLLIEYRLKPLLNIPLTWITEITHAHAPHYFIDEQKIGPYQLWHHEHWFVQKDNGVLMTDKVYYQVGWGILGKALEKTIVDKKVQDIFLFREQELNKLFNIKK